MSERIPIALGNKIREMRILQSMTQAELAEKAELSESMIRKVESGVHSFSLESLQRAANALHMPIHMLLSDEDGRNLPKACEKIMCLLSSKTEQEQTFFLELIRWILAYQEKQGGQQDDSRSIK